MKVRGERECQDCGTVWSYYDTGSVTCPDCGSLRSVGVDDRRRHTALQVDLDLTDARNRIAEADGIPREAVADLKQALREYRRKRGFVHAGDLQPLDDTFLAACELLQAVDVYGRLRDPTDEDRLYVLSLLRGAEDGERPAPEEVPASMWEARGLAIADALDSYREDVLEFLEDDPHPEVRSTLGSLRDRLTRIDALQGDVDPAEAERLVNATRDLYTYIDEGSEPALARATNRIGESVR